MACFILRSLIVFLAAAIWAAGVEVSATEADLVRTQQLIQSGDLHGARSRLEELRSHFPADPRIYNLLGVIDAQEKNFLGAESNFRHAVELAPRFTGAYLNLGRLYQERAGGEDKAKALEMYHKILEFEPDHVEANYQAAWLLNRLGKFSSSLIRLARLPRDAQDRAPALAVLGSDELGLGKRAEAESAFQKLSTAGDLTEADVLSILAILHEHSGDELATRLLETLARRGLASKAGLQALAALEEQQGRLKEAREWLEKDLQLEPPTAPVLIRLAKLAYQSSDLEGAAGYLAHARDLEPNNAAIHFFFGIVCVDLKLPPEAKQSLKEAVRLDGDNAIYHYALGAVLLQEKDADGAIPHLQKYQSTYRDDPHGHFALGVAYFDAYQLEASRRELEIAAARPETAVGANLYLGRIAFREGDLEKAEEFLNKAVESSPLSPDAYAELALIQIRRERYALAESTLAKGLRIAPDHYRTNLNLLMLYQRTHDARAEQQAQVVQKLEKAGEERERLLLRSLDIRPY